VRQSLILLERALALDPSNVSAWIELSRAHSFLAAQIDTAPGANIVQARAAAEKALALDPASGDAHAALADIKLNYDLDAHAAAELGVVVLRMHRGFLLRRTYAGPFARHRP
jgi:tetratricopeptide (TPR) repeat protein